jgi:serine/threonine protein kinase
LLKTFNSDDWSRLSSYHLSLRGTRIDFVDSSRSLCRIRSKHPNIFTIFEIGQQDQIHFIATEYIDGLSLRQIISKESFRIEQSIRLGDSDRVGTQRQHTLQESFTAISNLTTIMVRSDGFVKVLDFGLAKLGEHTSRTSDPEAATLQVVQTDPGKIMGTAITCHLKQTRGLQLDERTDIWSWE